MKLFSSPILCLLLLQLLLLLRCCDGVESEKNNILTQLKTQPKNLRSSSKLESQSTRLDEEDNRRKLVTVCLLNLGWETEFPDLTQAYNAGCNEDPGIFLRDGEWCILGECPPGYEETGYAQTITLSRNGQTFVTHVALSYDGLTMVLGEVAFADSKGRVRVMERDAEGSATGWTQKGSPIATDISPLYDDEIGMDVSVNRVGNVIGFSRYNFNTSELSEGAVEIYQFNGVDWEVKGTRLEGGGKNIALGKHMQLSADGLTLAYSMPFENSSAGEIHVKKFENGDWVPKGNPIGGIAFGMLGNLDVALSAAGDIVMFSVGLDAVDVFEYNDRTDSWSRRNPSQSTVMIPDHTPDSVSDLAFFGSALAMNGNASIVAVAESKTPGLVDTMGFVHIYFWNSATLNYDHLSYLQGWHDSSNCGIDLDLDETGETLVVGCSKIGDNLTTAQIENNGWVFVYKWTQGTQYNLFDIIKDDGIDQNEAGTQVDVSGSGNSIAISTTLNHEVRTFEYSS